MMKNAICATLLLLAFAAVHGREIDVDCDAGGDLGAVLNRLAMSRPSGLIRGENSDATDVAVTINISGTCVGNFVIAAAGLNLRGVGPGPDAAVLQGAAPIHSVTPVVEIRGVVGTAIRNLTITGGSTGLRVRNADALVLDCEFHGNGNGVLSEGSQTTIADSVISDNATGVQSLLADFVSLQNSTVVDNEQVGIFVIGGSRLLMDGGEVHGNLFGIKLLDNSSAFLRQPLVIGDTTGGSHLDAINHSTLTLNDGVIVSGNNDIEIGNNSILQSREAMIGVDVRLFQFGHAALRGTTIDGDLILNRFSNAVLMDGASVSGVATCDATSDADCSSGIVDGASNCKNCSGVSASPTAR